MNSGTVVAGTDGCTTITYDTRMIPLTGAMSRIKLKLRFVYRVALSHSGCQLAEAYSHRGVPSRPPRRRYCRRHPPGSRALFREAYSPRSSDASHSAMSFMQGLAA